MSCICFEKVESGICSFSCFTVRTDTGAFKLAVSGKHLRFQTEHTDHAGFPLRNSIDLTGVAHPFGDKFSAALFRHRDITFLKTVFVDVGEVDIIKFHAAQLFQLFFHSTAHLKGKLQNLSQLFFRELTVRIDELQKPIDHLPNGYGITLIEVGT